MGPVLTTADRGNATDTRAKENSVFLNSGQFIGLTRLSPGLALFLLQTAERGVKAGSLFCSFGKKAKEQRPGTKPTQISLSTAFNGFWTKL